MYAMDPLHYLWPAPLAIDPFYCGSAFWLKRDWHYDAVGSRTPSSTPQ